jgi:hypothetical protein
MGRRMELSKNRRKALVPGRRRGVQCPFGCNVYAWRMYGLVCHLVNKHGYTEDEAWKKVW